MLLARGATVVLPAAASPPSRPPTTRCAITGALSPFFLWSLVEAHVDVPAPAADSVEGGRLTAVRSVALRVFVSIFTCSLSVCLLPLRHGVLARVVALLHSATSPSSAHGSVHPHHQLLKHRP